MKKILKSALPPKGLTVFVESYPAGHHVHTWKSFDADRRAKKELQQCLYADQKGLCAYCEIDLTFTPPNKGGAAAKGDFRIEHFHPKDDASRDWAFDWRNLLATCTGGDETKLIDVERVADSKKNHHCDSRKRDKNLDDKILNPLEVPAFPPLFVVDEMRARGDALYFKPDKEACDSVSADCYDKALQTLEELNLNCDLLAQLRFSAVQRWKKEVERKIRFGLEPDSAIEQVMEMAFASESKNWPPFFTALRAYFGVAAEKQLKKIHYNG